MATAMVARPPGDRCTARQNVTEERQAQRTMSAALAPRNRPLFGSPTTKKSAAAATAYKSAWPCAMPNDSEMILTSATVLPQASGPKSPMSVARSWAPAEKTLFMQSIKWGLSSIRQQSEAARAAPEKPRPRSAASEVLARSELRRDAAVGLGRLGFDGVGIRGVRSHREFLFCVADAAVEARALAQPIRVSR